MSFDPYKDNPLEARAEARGLNWRWFYLNALGILPEQVSPYIMNVADTLYRLTGPDPERVRSAVRLQELVERYAVRVAAEGWSPQTDTASLDIYPPLSGEEPWEISDSARLAFPVSVQAPTLPEAVEKALEELGDEESG